MNIKDEVAVKPKPFFVVISTVFCVAILALIFFLYSMDTKKDEFSYKLRESLDSQANISLIIYHLGYSGMIHNVKNYVLRGDDYHYQAALENFKQIDHQLENSQTRYRGLGLDSEIKHVKQVVKQYEVNLELARRLHNKNMAPSKIDEQVRVDDTLASRALRNIIAQHQMQSANLLRDQLFRDQKYKNHIYLIAALSLCLAMIACSICWILVANARYQLREHQKISSKQKLLDASPNPTLVVAESGEIVVANQGAGRLFECDADVLIGRSIEDFMAESMRTQHVHYRTLFFNSSGERTMRNPVALTTDAGELKRVEVQIGIYRLGQDRFALVNLLDVSKVENIKRHADEVEETFRMTFELAPVGIAQISLEGHFIKVNRQFSSLLGYQANELELLSIYDISPAEERYANQLAIKRLINSDTHHVRFEKCYKSRDGVDVWVIHTLSLYRNSKNQPEYLISIFEDVSYRKKYEEDLLASEAKFKSIANHVQGVVWMATPGMDTVLFVSNRYEEIWGRSIESLKQKPTSFIDAMLPEDQPKVLAEIENHRKGVWNVKYRILGRDGTIRHIHDEATPVRGASGELLCLVGLARDVTEEYIAKEHLQKSNKQLEQLAKFDPLTMAVRRPYAMTELEECIALHKRYGTEATLIFIDLNDFKNVNDNHGHETGDLVLSEFAVCVRANIRETDAFYRYAGDEFLLLLRETSAEEALSFLHKFEAALQGVKLSDYPEVTVTISRGVTELGGEAITDARGWINSADEKMYQHKRELKKNGTS